MAVVKWSAVWLLLLIHWASLGWTSGPPKVSGKPHQRHLAKRGKNTKLVCPVEADPMPFTEWKKDGEKINSAWTRFKVNQDGHLRIRDVQMADAGLYVCRATNGFGSISINYTVIVLDEEKGLVQQQDSTFPRSPHEDLTKDGMAPEFKDLDKMERDRSLARPVGSTVRLKCRAKGNPEPHVTWFKDDLPVDAEEDARRRPHWILKLPRVREADSGLFTCMVSNRLGHVNFTYQLEVIDQVRTKPKLISSHPQNTTVETGGTASFQCRVKSLVQPHINWLKRVEDGDAGQAPNRTIEVKGQKFVVLRTAGEVLSAPDDSYLNKLVIHHATPKDAGMYLCLGANTNGYSLRSAYLNVVPAGQLPISDPPSSSSNLPLYLGVPAGVVLVIIILLILLLQNRRKCSTNRANLKRHRLPVPTQERDAGFYNTYHPSPTTTNTLAGGTGTVTSGSNTINNMHVNNAVNNVHCNNSLHNSNSLHTPANSLQLSREKMMPKTPAPSLDFGSDISSVSHSQSHPHHQLPHLPPPAQQSMHYLNPHIAYGY